MYRSESTPMEMLQEWGLGSTVSTNLCICVDARAQIAFC